MIFDESRSVGRIVSNWFSIIFALRDTFFSSDNLNIDRRNLRDTGAPFSMPQMEFANLFVQNTVLTEMSQSSTFLWARVLSKSNRLELFIWASPATVSCNNTQQHTWYPSVKCPTIFAQLMAHTLDVWPLAASDWFWNVLTPTFYRLHK